MRNLKKFLALVLAMVMAFSLMLSASAATANGTSDFNDSEEVTQAFKEAVAVLTGLEVIKGDGSGEKKDFRPQSEITRAEAAALVYRIATGDVSDKQVGLYADYSNFVDVKPRSATDDGDWFAGYVGYCQNAGIIKGTSPTTFNPYGQVTGYEVLAMILRAVGYGKNNEFTGPTWQVEVASLAKTKHITDSITSASYNYTLNMNARREIVAELLFRGAMIPQVNWTPGLGYVAYDNSLNNRTNYLAGEVFGLYQDAWGKDTWGRPQVVWKASLNPTSSPARTVAKLTAQPKETFHDEQRECDVAELMEFGTAASKDYILYVNGSTAVTNDYHIVATDTVTRVGGYGRLVEIYTEDDMNAQFPFHNFTNYAAGDGDKEEGVNAPEDTIVMIDTYLAKVVNKTECVKDAAGHVITPAKLIVDLYDRNDSLPFDKADSAKVAQRRTIQKPATSDANWDDFAIGDVISLNGLSKSYNGGVGARVGGSDEERWAYTLPTVANPSAASNWDTALVQNTNVFNLTKLNGVQAKQTTVYWNNGKHQVGGEDKTDDLALRMDKAGSNIDTTYTWYYDQYGYLLGIDDGGKASYGVITSVYAAFGQGETDTNGLAKAIATVKYADGTTGTETIDYFMVHGTELKNTDVSGMTRGTASDAMADNSNTLQLWPIYDVNSKNPMLENVFPYGMSLQPTHGQERGVLYMSPVAASNTYAATDNQLNWAGVLNNNLFKFVKSSGDKTVAVEVAGGGTTYTQKSTNANGDWYEGHWAATNTDGKLYKNLAYITTGSGAATNANIVAWLDDDTQIMIRGVNGGITCYDGVSALPGDVTIVTSAAAADGTNNRRYNEIDWADTDDDGRADVVYLTGAIDGVTTYGLFYTNDLTAQWNGTTATISGFLNGEETTLTFTNYDEFNKIRSATGYNAHLFAVRQTNGVVSNVMVDDFNTTGQLLPNDGDILNQFNNGKSSSSRVATGIQTVGGDQFQYGADVSTTKQFAGINPYTRYTEAVYFEDHPDGTAGQWSVAYNPAYNWSQMGADVVATNNGTGETRRFHLTPNSKIYGLGSGVVLAEGYTALEYLNHSSQINNHVTIVYENNYTTTTANATFSVLEMYIQTDPNYTPTTPETAWSASGTSGWQPQLGSTGISFVGSGVITLQRNGGTYTGTALTGTLKATFEVLSGGTWVDAGTVSASGLTVSTTGAIVCPNPLPCTMAKGVVYRVTISMNTTTTGDIPLWTAVQLSY